MTQIEFESISLETAVRAEEEAFGLQNRGAELKQRSARQAGKVWTTKTLSEIKNDTERLHVSFKTAKRCIKEAAVSEIVYALYLEQKKQKAQEITNSGLSRVGKAKTTAKIFSVAAKILEKLKIWDNKPLLLDAVVTKQCVGSDEEIQQVKNLLLRLAASFQTYADAL